VLTEKKNLATKQYCSSFRGQ